MSPPSIALRDAAANGAAGAPAPSPSPMATETSAAQRPLVAVVVHDVAPATWPLCARLLDDLRRLGELPVTLLAVPRYHGAASDAAFEQALTALQAAGHELALHGYLHCDDQPLSGALDRLRRRFYTAGEGEFAALTREQALPRLRAGMAWFAQNGWALNGFVAPAWLSSAGTWSAVRELGFTYACTLTQVVPLQEGAPPLQSRSIVYSTRAAWRRALSLPWNAVVGRSERRRPLLRFELHPPDVLYPAVRASWLRMLERALHERQVVTLAQAVERLATEPGPQR